MTACSRGQYVEQRRIQLPRTLVSCARGRRKGNNVNRPALVQSVSLTPQAVHWLTNDRPILSPVGDTQRGKQYQHQVISGHGLQMGLQHRDTLNIFYWFWFESFPTSRARSPYLYPLPFPRVDSYDWEPWCLTTLQASKACCRVSFTFRFPRTYTYNYMYAEMFGDGSSCVSSMCNPTFSLLHLCLSSDKCLTESTGESNSNKAKKKN
jgi:hypothetical protein